MSSDVKPTLKPGQPPRPAGRGILLHDPALEPEIFALQKSVYPQRREDWIASRWRWMFLSSAERLGTAPMICVYRNASGVVAHQGVIPVRLRVDGSEHDTGWFVETMTSQSVRGKPIGPMVIQKSLELLPFNLSLGQTEQMRAIQLAMGWQVVAPLQTYALIVDARKTLAGKGPRALRPLAALGLNSLQALRVRRGAIRLDWEPATSEVDRFGEAADLLWRRVRDEHPAAVVRDSSYLNWKYVEQPAQSFIRLTIRRRNEVVAVAVLQIYEPSSVYAYRRAFLVEFVAPCSEPEIVWAALDASVRECRRRGADMLTFHFISRRLRPLVERFGFFRRESTRVLLVATGNLAAERRQVVLSPDSWLVTMGDSDIDRPW